MNNILETKLNQIKQSEILSQEIYEFLCAYYDEVVWGAGNLDEHEYPIELTVPLQDRASGVYEAMKWLIENNYDVNSGDCFNPLMMAVGSADWFMTKYLIENGADANYWPDPDPWTINYYLEDIDIQYLNSDMEDFNEQYIQALLKTTQVLLEDGNTGSFFGLCLSADAEKREISLSGPSYKF